MKRLFLLPLIVSSLSFAAYGQEDKTEPTRTFLKHTIAFAPLQLTENGPGLGLSYERYLDKNNRVSFYLPVYYTWNYISDYSTPPKSVMNPMFYITPGVKLYIFPMGYRNVEITYAAGASLVFGFGSETNFNSTLSGTKVDRSIFGVMINNSLNTNVTDNIYAGAEFGLGYTYINNENGTTTTQKVLIQFAAKIGYNF